YRRRCGSGRPVPGGEIKTTANKAWGGPPGLAVVARDSTLLVPRSERYFHSCSRTPYRNRLWTPCNFEDLASAKMKDRGAAERASGASEGLSTALADHVCVTPPSVLVGLPDAAAHIGATASELVHALRNPVSALLTSLELLSGGLADPDDVR